MDDAMQRTSVPIRYKRSGDQARDRVCQEEETALYLWSRRHADTCHPAEGAEGEEAEAEEEESLDPYFFDPGYTLAASTGFLVWEGAMAFSVLLQAIMHRNDGASAHGPDGVDRSSIATLCAKPEIQRLCRLLQRGHGDGHKRVRVVELGAGTGMVGLTASLLSPHVDVILTDVEPVTAHLLRRNVLANALPQAATTTNNSTTTTTTNNNNNTNTPFQPLKGGMRGRAMALPLDWCDLPPCLQHNDPSPFDADILLATDTIWLKDLVPPFVQTVRCLLGRHPNREAMCFLAFQERAGDTSTTFTHLEQVWACFEGQGCRVTCLGSWASPVHRVTDTHVEAYSDAWWWQRMSGTKEIPMVCQGQLHLYAITLKQAQ